MGTYMLQYNSDKNRVAITVEGSLSYDETLKLKEEYRELIKNCRRGFTVLTDLVNFIPGSHDVQEIHAEMVKMDSAAGVSKIARVVGETPLGGMQIRRIARSEGGYPSANFATKEDAELYLDKDAD